MLPHNQKGTREREGGLDSLFFFLSPFSFQTKHLVATPSIPVFFFFFFCILELSSFSFKEQARQQQGNHTMSKNKSPRRSTPPTSTTTATTTGHTIHTTSSTTSGSLIQDNSQMPPSPTSAKHKESLEAHHGNGTGPTPASKDVSCFLFFCTSASHTFSPKEKKWRTPTKTS